MKNEPAFPLQFEYQNGGKDYVHGLTKREYFAAMALQGLLSDKGPLFPDSQCNKELFATASVKYADALIAELEKEGME